MNCIKRQKDTTPKEEPHPRLVGAQYDTGEEQRNNSKRMKRWSQSENNAQLSMRLMTEVKSNAVKKQYCIGKGNVRSMNQGKLQVVKQEMARVNIDILGISELKWAGMCEFNSDDHYMYYCWQESLRRNGVVLTVNQSPKCSTWVES